MREELPWLHVPWTRIYYYAEDGGFLPMEMERHQRLAAPAAGATITMLREGRVSAMENGECSRASPSRQQGTLGEPMFY